MTQIAIITGASKGIGRHIAIQLAQQDYVVVPVARSLDLLNTLAEEITAEGGACHPFAADLTQEADVNALLDFVGAHFGQVDVLVNNAGVGVFKNVEDLSFADWKGVLAVNLDAMFLLTRACVPHMKARKCGTILTVMSDVSRRTFPRGSVYCASKYAQDAFMSAIRQELRAFNIRVCTVLPGITRTSFDGTPDTEDRKADWLDAAEVARSAVYAITAPANVVIDEITIHPISQDY